MLAVTTIVLDAREKILARPLSLIGTVMSFFVYYPAGLYAKCLLNCLYLVLNVYSWYHWLYGGKHRTLLQVSKTSLITLMRMLLLGILGTFVLGCSLQRLANADLAYWDSLHTVMCLAAQWMLARKKLESWILWIIADVMYSVVCYYKGLYLFSGLHTFFIVLAVNGYRTWCRSYLQQSVATTGTTEQHIQ